MRFPHDNLQKEGFEVLVEVPHARFLEFLKNIKWSFSGWQMLYLMVLITGLVGVLLSFKQSSVDYFFVLSFALLGICLTIPLLWMHEAIHFWAFRRVGAKHVHIKSDWRKLYFLTLADRFVITKTQWIRIALLPSVIITLTGSVTMVFLSYLWQIALGTALVLHWTSCKADFKIVYYLRRQKSPVKAYTDLQTGKTYIYRQRKSRE